MASLTKKQKSLMSKHSEHHSAKHMQDMTKSMNSGKSFSAVTQISPEKGR